MRTTPLAPLTPLCRRNFQKIPDRFLCQKTATALPLPLLFQPKNCGPNSVQPRGVSPMTPSLRLAPRGPLTMRVRAKILTGYRRYTDALQSGVFVVNQGVKCDSRGRGRGLCPLLACGQFTPRIFSARRNGFGLGFSRSVIWAKRA